MQRADFRAPLSSSSTMLFTEASKGEYRARPGSSEISGSSLPQSQRDGVASLFLAFTSTRARVLVWHEHCGSSTKELSITSPRAGLMLGTRRNPEFL